MSRQNDVSVTAEDPQPARSPSPARNPPSTIVHVRGLVRPYTLGQLKVRAYSDKNHYILWGWEPTVLKLYLDEKTVLFFWRFKLYEPWLVLKIKDQVLVLLLLKLKLILLLICNEPCWSMLNSLWLWLFKDISGLTGWCLYLFDLKWKFTFIFKVKF